VDEDGRVLSPAQVRREVHDYVEGEKDKTEKEALKLLAETITLTAFFHFMKSRVEKWHTVTGAIAYGGQAQLDPERKARIAAKIESELAFLNGFRNDTSKAFAEARANDLTITEAAGFVPARAAMYADAAYSTYENNVMAREFDEGVTMGRRVCPEDDASCEECVDAASTFFSTLEDIEEIGTLQCLNNCRCYIEYADAPLTANVVVDRTQQSDAVQ